uniref:peptidylprolyl isomerase n=1 Tax=Strigamia maritima TaxID=126957 RepID=T1JDQ0_STRMM
MSTENTEKTTSDNKDQIINAENNEKKEILIPGSNAVDISIKKDGGVLKEILKEGEGEEYPFPGDQVKVHYVGRLTDGSEFDSSRERGDLFEFSLGSGGVIKAWDIGVATMKKGEICNLYCKAEYAYGKSGSPPKIPPNATLVFEIELFSWEGEDLTTNKDKGIIRRHVKEGEGYSTPNDGAMVTVHLVGKHEGRVFEDRDVTFAIGEGLENGVVDGIEKALEKFKKGETSRLLLKSNYAFGNEGKPEFNIPSNADIEYDVTLNSFEKAKENWEMDNDEKLEQANICKTKGTNYFKAGNFKLAIKQYKKVIELVENIPGDDENKEHKQLTIQGYLNLAISYLKMKEAFKAAKAADNALGIDPDSEKGHFRRGLARLEMKEIELAKEDFSAVLKIDASNKAAANQIIICNKMLKEQHEKEKKLYSNMFTKYVKPDGQNGNSNKDVLVNPGTWGDDDSRKKKPDSAGDGQGDKEEEKTKEQRLIDSLNSESVELL